MHVECEHEADFAGFVCIADHVAYVQPQNNIVIEKESPSIGMNLAAFSVGHGVFVARHHIDAGALRINSGRLQVESTSRTACRRLM